MKINKFKRVIDELKKAEIQEDGSIKIDMEWEGSKGTINYNNFRVFCDELIRKLLTS